jgi:large subunit ribosomal protein L1
MPTTHTKGSKKYRSNKEIITKALGASEKLTIEKAVETLFALEQPKFKDGAMVELHFNLNINPTKSDQLVRGSVVLPNGLGKKIVIAAFVNPENIDNAKSFGADIVGGDDLIEQLKTSQTVNFDIAIAEPAMMKKLPAIARLLGTRGVMPNPKSGTVGDNLEEMIKQIKAGKVDFKNDKTGNVHIPCGKINDSFTVEKIVENVKAAIDAVEKIKPEVIKKKYIVSVHLASSLSPSIPVSL